MLAEGEAGTPAEDGAEHVAKKIAGLSTLVMCISQHDSSQEDFELDCSHSTRHLSAQGRNWGINELAKELVYSSWVSEERRITKKERCQAWK